MKTTIAGIGLENPVYNASGPKCVTLEELKGIGNSASGAILTKSCTKEERGGNPEPRYFDMGLGSINSMGLPNLGYKKYVEMIPELKRHGKPVFVSVAGLTLEDNIEIISALNSTEADAIELNLSCPNLVGKPQVAYDFDAADTYLRETMRVSGKKLGVKLPPYFDFAHFEQIAKVLNKHKPSFVSAINSVGNGLVIDPKTETAVIKPKGGFGGIGGIYVKPTALANVRKLHELLDKGIDVVGVGGIYTGVDVFEFVLCGAKAVQLGTVYMQQGPEAFERISKEFDDYAGEKGYGSIEEFRGKLKAIQ